MATAEDHAALITAFEDAYVRRMAEFRRRHSWKRFSLKSFLLTLALIAVPCGWLASAIRSAESERHAIRALDAALEVAGMPPNYWTNQGARSVRRLDSFHHSILSVVQHKNPRRAILNWLDQFPGYLESATFRGPYYADEHVLLLKNCRYLVEVTLTGTSASEEAIAELRRAHPHADILVREEHELSGISP